MLGMGSQFRLEILVMPLGALSKNPEVFQVPPIEFQGWVAELPNESPALWAQIFAPVGTKFIQRYDILGTPTPGILRAQNTRYAPKMRPGYQKGPT